MNYEKLMRYYAAGNESAPDELYRNNVGLIKKIAYDAVYSFGCLTYGRYGNSGLTSYAEDILSELEQEGALTLFRKVRGKRYPRLEMGGEGYPGGGEILIAIAE